MTTKPIKKSEMPCNSPRATPGHPKKSHVVKACAGGKSTSMKRGKK